MKMRCCSLSIPLAFVSDVVGDGEPLVVDVVVVDPRVHATATILSASRAIAARRRNMAAESIGGFHGDRFRGDRLRGGCVPRRPFLPFVAPRRSGSRPPLDLVARGRSVRCPTMSRRYDAAEIEPRWIDRWEAEGLYRAVDDPADERPRFYALDMFPYPSGDLHMGHAEAFSGGDAVARYQALRGHNVMHPIGWDAFGLNAENAAIKRGTPPAPWTYANIEQQAASFRRMGMSFDWSRRVQTCDPEYYRWTQWLFLRLFEQGLAYRKGAQVNWCPKDQTVLANEQVIGGACERCGTPVERRELTQWFFKITDYAQRLLDDVELLTDWPDRVVTMQRNWIGRSEGAEVTFTIAETGEEVTVFTTRPDTLWGATFFVFAIEHPDVKRLAELGGTWHDVEPLVRKAQQTSLVDREAADTKEGVFLGVHAVNPVNGERIPCYAAPYVLMGYGTGAIMAVPAHDERDFAFARAHDLPVRVVIQPADAPAA